MIRKAEREQRGAVSRYNQVARRYNAELKRAEREYNRDVDKYNAAVRQDKRENEAYTRKARAHNARVRQDRQRLINELNRLQRQASAAQYVAVQTSVHVLKEAYQRVDVASGSWRGTGLALADLAEAETANSATTANALLGGEADLQGEQTRITDELRIISAELDKRWHGALFSLDSRNPDAARHFCTSSREILTRVIDLEAPDNVVLEALPDCETLGDGRPIRRAKIGYLLRKSGADYESLREFVETDVDDVMKLFRVFNDATHGDAGVFDLNVLRALKQRVEGAIKFLSAIVRPAT